MRLIEQDTASGPEDLKDEPFDNNYELGQVLYRAWVGGMGVYIRFAEYKVIRLTPKGAWIADQYEVDRESKKEHGLEALSEAKPYSWEKWVNLPDRCRWCSPTKKEAAIRLKYRTWSYEKHCRRRLKEAERRSRVIQTVLGEKPELGPPAKPTGMFDWDRGWG